MIPRVEHGVIVVTRESENERDEPRERRSLKKDYMKAFACETCSGIASTGSTANDEDLRMLLRVRWREKEEENRAGIPLEDKEWA
jgi:hypothetical protein